MVREKISPVSFHRRWHERALAGVLLGLLSIDTLPLPVQCYTYTRCDPAAQPPAVGGCHARQAQRGGRRGIVAPQMP